MSNRTVVAIALIAAMAVGGLSICFFSEGESEERGAASENAAPAAVAGGSGKQVAPPQRQAIGRKAERQEKVVRPGRKVRVIGSVKPETDDYSPEDRRRVDAVMAALDEENLEAMRLAAAEAMKSSNPEVRQEAVDSLGWFGEKVLPDLAKAMADPDPDVADTARGQVDQALSGMEDSREAFAIAASYAAEYWEDASAAEMLLGVMECAGVQLVDPDDPDSDEDVRTALAQRADVVTALSGLIERGGRVAKMARETYESISGAAWTDRAAADRWAAGVADPESEEEPDDSDGTE